MLLIFRVCFLVTLALLLTACGNSMTDQQYVERAQVYLDEGNLKAASIELKNALSINRNHPQARWMLGKIHLEIGNNVSAEKELRLASELGIVDESVYPALARALLAQGKNEELQALALTEIRSKEKAAIVLAAKGLGDLQSGALADATIKIQRAILLDKKSPYALVVQARLLAVQENYAEARETLNGVIAMKPDYAPAWSLLGELESREKNYQAAEQAYTRAIENRRNNSSDYLRRANARMLGGRYEEAQQDIDVLRGRSQTGAGVSFVQGVIHLRNREYGQAQEAFDRTLAADGGHLQAVFNLALAHLLLNNKTQAEEYATRFVSAVPRSIRGRKLLATIKQNEGQYAAAEELIRPVVAHDDKDVGAANLLANALLKQGKLDQAILLLARVVSLKPDSAIPHLRLGVAQVAVGNQAEGLNQIEKALQLDPDLQQAREIQIQIYLKQQEIAKALDAAKAYRDRDPESAIAQNLLGRVYVALGQDAEAEQAFIKALEAVPGDPEASHGLAALAIGKADYPHARRLYQAVLENEPNHLRTLVNLALLDAGENKHESMLGHLQKAVAAHPDDIQPRILLGRYYLAKGDPEQISLLISEMDSELKNAPAVVKLVAMAQLAQKEYLDAKLGLEQLIKRQPDSAEAHMLMAQAYAGLGDRSGAEKELKAVIDLAPDYVEAKIVLARLLILDDRKDQASDLLTSLDQTAPEHPDVLQLKADFARGEGNQEAASELLEKAFQISPSTSSMLSLVRQKFKSGEQAESIELQEQWVADNPGDLTAAMVLADSYRQSSQTEEAVLQFQRVLEKDADNVFALNNLAWSLRNKQPEKALEYAEEANRIRPDSPEFMDTLAIVLLNNGDTLRAQRTIERVLEKDATNPTFRYHSAVIEYAAGNSDQALKRLKEVLKNGRDFPEKGEAERLYEELSLGG